MSLLIIGLAIYNKDIPILIFGCATLLFALVLFMPLYKRWIYNIVKKKANAPMNIKVSFDNDGFYYLLEHENPEDFPKFEYNQVAHVIELPEYILMFFTPNTIAIIKKNECSEIDELRELLYKMNVKIAYNLDGGSSTQTVFHKTALTPAYKEETGRKIPTVITFEVVDSN